MEKLKLNDTEKFKGTWDGTNFSFERDRSFGFSWPQRNYTCSFCRKEYKSAQALGGHMNVHRRDRAKQLIQQSSPSQEISLTSKPNPNPNFTPPVLAKPVPSAARFLPYNYHASSSQHDDLLSTQIRDTRKKMGMEAYVYKIGEFNSSKNQENESRVWKKREVLGLDMKIGGQIRDVKEDLDLELRLGCS